MPDQPSAYGPLMVCEPPSPGLPGCGGQHPRVELPGSRQMLDPQFCFNTIQPSVSQAYVSTGLSVMTLHAEYGIVSKPLILAVSRAFFLLLPIYGVYI